MTGYGSAEGPSSLGPISIEIRSVNHRFCDITLKLSRKLGPLENRIKELIRDRFSRGRFDMVVRLDSSERNGYRLEPNVEMGRQYLDALKRLKNELKLTGEITIEMIAQAKDVIVAVENEEETEKYWEEIQPVIEHALDGLKAMRRQEGQSLSEDLQKRIGSVRTLVDGIVARAPQVTEAYRHKLGQRLERVLNGTEVDPIRFDQEVAFFAERSDISEEAVRILSHLAQLEQTMKSDGAMGRKLEFLVQEIHREANTVSSKANDETISHAVVEIKGELEKIREQIQNLE
jgi:uncharacterized protein (TIGR00255 family)